MKLLLWCALSGAIEWYWATTHPMPIAYELVAIPQQIFLSVLCGYALVNLPQWLKEDFSHEK